MTSHTIPGDWEGPPKGYDWYRDTKVARTQADNLPRDRIRANDYEDWQTQVKAILAGYGLTDLIDVKLDRPKTTDNRGERWKRISLSVVVWLKQSISPDLLKELEQKHRRFIFADEVFHAIKTHMDCASPHADAETLTQWEKLSVIDFPTTSRFIDEVLLAMKRLNDRHMPMNPYAVIMKIIYGIGINDNDMKTRLCNDWVSQKKDPKTFTALDLENMVKQIKQELSAEEQNDVTIKPETET
ncbi:uncharacterized protein N7483_002069 [Penicillium malachiteum]|uniref:uncharacterized protein n=1 Tax=Penicillium malachiteum TaxID=1324776 RepID=UPI0025469EAE|nr:uncharacterized protein N7483_002069 [Penicillium malachiteum]KAJ5736944.1 hypothetical protein N7483_002069 [Penicillium malachiteum]